MTVASLPLEMPIGNSKTIRFECLDGSNQVVTGGWTGSTLIFRAVKLHKVQILRKVIPHDGTVATLTLTPAETRLFSLGPQADYEIERRIAGEEVTLIQGRITGTLGVNDDG